MTKSISDLDVQRHIEAVFNAVGARDGVAHFQSVLHDALLARNKNERLALFANPRDKDYWQKQIAQHDQPILDAQKICREAIKVFGEIENFATLPQELRKADLTRLCGVIEGCGKARDSAMDALKHVTRGYQVDTDRYLEAQAELDKAEVDRRRATGCIRSCNRYTRTNKNKNRKRQGLFRDRGFFNGDCRNVCAGTGAWNDVPTGCDGNRMRL
jgi:hypothetical protein